MSNRPGADAGSSFSHPLRTIFKRTSSQGPGRDDLIYRANPKERVDRMWDFEEALAEFRLDMPGVTIATTSATKWAVVVPRSGYLIAASLTALATLAADDTNYLTFTLINLLGAGAGSGNLLAANTDASITTKTTGGTALTLERPRTLALSATAANLWVNAGDVLEFIATATGTLANTVTVPSLELRFATLPEGLVPGVVRTAGVPRVGPVAGTANGEATIALTATSEAQHGRIDFGDQTIIPGTKRAIFKALVKIPTALTTAQRVIIGLTNAFNATAASISRAVWFRLEASMALTIEGTDGTTTTRTQSAGITLTAGNYYLFSIDMSDPLNVKFWVEDVAATAVSEYYCGSIAVGALAVTDLLQPLVWVQKDSGTGVPSATVDFLRVLWDRN